MISKNTLTKGNKDNLDSLDLMSDMRKIAEVKICPVSQSSGFLGWYDNPVAVYKLPFPLAVDVAVANCCYYGQDATAYLSLCSRMKKADKDAVLKNSPKLPPAIDEFEQIASYFEGPVPMVIRSFQRGKIGTALTSLEYVIEGNEYEVIRNHVIVENRMVSFYMSRSYGVKRTLYQII